MKQYPKALLFVEFRLKTENLIAAKKLGYTILLLTENPRKGAHEIFDEIFTVPFNNPSKIEAFCREVQEKYDLQAVLTNYDEFVIPRSYFAQKLGFPASSLYSACCARNKVMQRHQLHFLPENIPSRIITNEQEAEEGFKALGEDIYLKPLSGIKSKFVWHVQTPQALKKAYTHFLTTDRSNHTGLYNDFTFFDFDFEYPDPKTTCIMEKTIYGQQVGVSSICGSRGITHLPSLCDIYTAEGVGKDDSFLAFRILPSKYPSHIVQKAHKVVESACNILGFSTNAVHAELFVLPDETLKIIEINARMAGYRHLMYPESFGVDVSETFLRTVLDQEVSMNEKPHAYVSLIEIFPDESGLFDSIEGLEAVVKSPETVYHMVKYKPGEKTGKARDGFKPTFVCMIKAPTYEEVYAKSMAYQKSLKVVLKTSE